MGSHSSFTKDCWEKKMQAVVVRDTNKELVWMKDNFNSEGRVLEYILGGHS